MRLQAAVKDQEVAAAALQTAKEAMEQARAVFLANQQAVAEAESRLQVAN